MRIHFRRNSYLSFSSQVRRRILGNSRKGLYKCGGDDKKVKYTRIDGRGETEDIVNLVEARGAGYYRKDPTIYYTVQLSN